MDELSPLAGSVGIELVPQTLSVMAGSHTDSESATQQQTDTQTASAPPPAEKQQQQQPQPQEGFQQQLLAEMPSHEEPAVHQQAGVAPHGSQLANNSGNSVLIEGQATAEEDSGLTSQQHKELPYQPHESDSPYGQHESRHESDDMHAVLIAASEDQSCDDHQGQMQAPEAKMSKQQSAAAERQRVWYKERAVQLTILG